MIKLKAYMVHENIAEKHHLGIQVTRKDFASVFILKTLWKAFHLNPKNLRLYRLFSERFKSAINKFSLYLPRPWKDITTKNPQK